MCFVNFDLVTPLKLILMSSFHLPCILMSSFHLPCILMSSFHLPCILMSSFHLPCILMSSFHLPCILMSSFHLPCILFQVFPPESIYISRFSHACYMTTQIVILTIQYSSACPLSVTASLFYPDVPLPPCSPNTLGP